MLNNSIANHFPLEGRRYILVVFLTLISLIFTNFLRSIISFCLNVLISRNSPDFRFLEVVRFCFLLRSKANPHCWLTMELNSDQSALYQYSENPPPFLETKGGQRQANAFLRLHWQRQCFIIASTPCLLRQRAMHSKRGWGNRKSATMLLTVETTRWVVSR